MIRALKLRLILVFFTAAASVSVTFAQDFIFPANQYGNIQMRPNQSLGGNDAFIQSQQNAAFEPIVEFNERDLFRERSRAVGRLEILVMARDGNQGVSTCTATLVTPDHILTNYHCIPSFNATVQKAQVSFGYLREDQTSLDSYPVDITPVAADPDLDFALLRVENRPGERYGFVPIVPVQAAPNASLVIYHHPAGLPLRITRFRCRAYTGQAYVGNEFRHRCDTLGGSSGALIYDNQHRVVALHHSGGLTGDSQTSFNSGTAIASVLGRINLASLGGSVTLPPLVDVGAAMDLLPKPSVDTATTTKAPDTQSPAVEAPATTSDPNIVFVTIKPNVSGGIMNVREKPGLDFKLVGTIPAGTPSVKVFAASCQKAIGGKSNLPWCLVSWNGTVGWASTGSMMVN